MYSVASNKTDKCLVCVKINIEKNIKCFLNWGISDYGSRPTCGDTVGCGRSWKVTLLLRGMTQIKNC